MVNKVTKPVVDKKEEKYRKEHFPDVNKIVDKKLLCTSCNISVKPLLLKGKPKVHPFMDTLLCDKCFAFFGDGDFSTDEDGSDKYCRWCGQGGTLYLCSKCTAGFCKRCIKRNLPRAVWKEVEDDDWKCLCCNVSPVYELRAQAWASLEYVKANFKDKNDTASRKRKAKGDSDSDPESKKLKKSDDEEDEEPAKAPRKSSREKSSKRKTRGPTGDEGSSDEDEKKKLMTKTLKLARSKLSDIVTDVVKIMDVTKRKAEDFKKKRVSVQQTKDMDSILASADVLDTMLLSVEQLSSQLRVSIGDFKTNFQKTVEELQNGLKEKKASEENGELDTSEKKDETNDSEGEKEKDSDKKDSTDVEMKEDAENDKAEDSTTKEDEEEDSKYDKDEKTKSDNESDLDKTVDPNASSEDLKGSNSKDDSKEDEDPKESN